MSLCIYELAKKINMRGDDLLALLRVRKWVAPGTRSISCRVSKIYVDEIEMEFANRIVAGVTPLKSIENPSQVLASESTMGTKEMKSREDHRPHKSGQAHQCATVATTAQNQLTRAETLHLYREEIKRMALVAEKKFRRRKNSKWNRKKAMLQGGSPGLGKRA